MSTPTQSLLEQLEAAGAAALEELGRCADAAALEEARVRHMGKKSGLSHLLRGLSDVPAEDRPHVGQVANRIKQEFQDAFEGRLQQFREGEREHRLASERIDITLPGRPLVQGRLHPLTQMLDEIEDAFTSLGFEVASGPDMEEEFYNFDALNIPKDHPAREMHDTFYLKNGGLLRTHTSPVQIRMMRKRQPPLAVIAPGKVYRCDTPDETHSPVFHQVEGFFVDTRVGMSDLKGVLGLFLRRLFGPEIRFRLRPSYFPFTEPSAEIDILWSGEGEPERWLEVLGAGMIHPKVIEAGGYDPGEVTGFAFGMGVERFAMLKYRIPSIRLFYENDVRFLEQF